MPSPLFSFKPHLLVRTAPPPSLPYLNPKYASHCVHVFGILSLVLLCHLSNSPQGIFLSRLCNFSKDVCYPIIL